VKDRLYGSIHNAEIMESTQYIVVVVPSVMSINVAPQQPILFYYGFDRRNIQFPGAFDLFSKS